LDGCGCLLTQNDYAATSIAPTTKEIRGSNDSSAAGENATREEQFALQRCRFIDELYASEQFEQKQLKSIDISLQPISCCLCPMARHAESILTQTHVFRNRVTPIATEFFLDMYDTECVRATPVALAAGHV